MLLEMKYWAIEEICDYDHSVLTLGRVWDALPMYLPNLTVSGPKWVVRRHQIELRHWG